MEDKAVCMLLTLMIMNGGWTDISDSTMHCYMHTCGKDPHIAGVHAMRGSLPRCAR